MPHVQKLSVQLEASSVTFDTASSPTLTKNSLPSDVEQDTIKTSVTRGYAFTKRKFNRKKELLNESKQVESSLRKQHRHFTENINSAHSFLSTPLISLPCLSVSFLHLTRRRWERNDISFTIFPFPLLYIFFRYFCHD